MQVQFAKPGNDIHDDDGSTPLALPPPFIQRKCGPDLNFLGGPRRGDDEHEDEPLAQLQLKLLWNTTARDSATYISTGIPMEIRSTIHTYQKQLRFARNPGGSQCGDVSFN